LNNILYKINKILNNHINDGDSFSEGKKYEKKIINNVIDFDDEHLSKLIDKIKKLLK
jgi:hypothetical protein